MTAMNTVLDRHEQRKQETHQRLLDAAEQVISRLGYEAASIFDITEAANVSKRTFYLHFDDKESLLEALTMRGFIELRDRVEAREAHFNDQEAFREGFYWISRMIFEYAEQNPNLMQIVFGKDGSFRVQAMARIFMAQAWEENMLRKCNFKDDAPVPPNIMANALAGIIFQLLCWWTQVPNDQTPDAMAKICVSLVYDGLEVNLLQENANLT